MQQQEKKRPRPFMFSVLEAKEQQLQLQLSPSEDVVSEEDKVRLNWRKHTDAQSETRLCANALRVGLM